MPARAVAYVRALPDHPLLDRIVRGRTWIAMLGVMLVGIVAMQVEELKLGASVGRGLSESAALQSKNQLLRATVSALSDDQRIERLAARMGMVMPAPGELVFLTPHPSDAPRAANQIQAPSPASFLAALPQATAGSTAGSTVAATGLGASTTAASTTGTAGTTAATTGPASTGTGGTPSVTPTGASTGASTVGTTAGAAGAASPAGSGTTGTATGAGATGTGATATGATATATSGGGAALTPVTTGH